jgi:hypothetical protein
MVVLYSSRPRNAWHWICRSEIEFLLSTNTSLLTCLLLLVGADLLLKKNMRKGREFSSGANWAVHKFHDPQSTMAAEDDIHWILVNLKHNVNKDYLPPSNSTGHTYY